MLSHKLIRYIQDHSEQLATTALARIREDPDLAQTNGLPEAELQEPNAALLGRLGTWLAGDEQAGIAHRYQELGKRRCEQDVPLQECVKCLHILKYVAVDYAREQGFPETPLEIYAEEEFEHRVDRFLDFLVYHLVRGYETALRTATPRPKRVAEAHW